jgi:hypothetical protein
MRVRTPIIAFVIAATTISSPAFSAAKRSGYNAQASVPSATESISADRAAALRDCAAATAGMSEYTWGVQIADTYRACMARHGQPE